MNRRPGTRSSARKRTPVCFICRKAACGRDAGRRSRSRTESSPAAGPAPAAPNPQAAVSLPARAKSPEGTAHPSGGPGGGIFGPFGFSPPASGPAGAACWGNNRSWARLSSGPEAGRLAFHSFHGRKRRSPKWERPAAHCRRECRARFSLISTDTGL